MNETVKAFVLDRAYTPDNVPAIIRTDAVGAAWRAENLEPVNYSRFHRGLAWGLALSLCFWLPIVYMVWG